MTGFSELELTTLHGKRAHLLLALGGAHALVLIGFGDGERSSWLFLRCYAPSLIVAPFEWDVSVGLVLEKSGTAEAFVDPAAGVRIVGKLMMLMTYQEALAFAEGSELLLTCIDPKLAMTRRR